MPEYIEREAAIESLIGWETEPTDEEIEYTLKKIPAANVVEVRHGYWIDVSTETLYRLKCSLCGNARLGKNTNYCCNCGAKMDVLAEREGEG
jgi:hypothetical protein